MIAPDTVQERFRAVQDRITDFLSGADGYACHEDQWDYKKGEGGGVTRVWEHANLIEKGGVNFSAVSGAELPESAATQFDIAPATPFFATGVSLVIHPWNPHIPTIHMNIRYFEAGERWWFGGGVDLTPYYPVREEVSAFHRALKALCDAHGEDYAGHKAYCDRYFYLPHREEMRGVGGLFFDHLHDDADRQFDFVTSLGNIFPELYKPFVENHRNRPWTDEQRAFQLYRRGRYVEFNLVYDRGTRFGLQSGGRTESILMSLPACAEWPYGWRPEPGGPEAELRDFYLQPQDWVGME